MVLLLQKIYMKDKSGVLIVYSLQVKGNKEALFLLCSIFNSNSIKYNEGLKVLVLLLTLNIFLFKKNSLLSMTQQNTGILISSNGSPLMKRLLVSLNNTWRFFGYIKLFLISKGSY